MYLKSLKICNFRKFRENNNLIKFAEGFSCKNISEDSEDEKINVSPNMTLIVGKNNSGKTTIINALDILINKGRFGCDDFNVYYLHNLFGIYKQNPTDEVIKDNSPTLEFEIEIGFNGENEMDVLSNLYQVLSISDIESDGCIIKIKYEIIENATFVDNVLKLISQLSYKDEQLIFDKFKKLINETEFTLNYYNSLDEKITNFKINDLIELTYIRANNIREDGCLTRAFAKIVEFKYQNERNTEQIPGLDDKIDNVNKTLTDYMKEKHSENFNKTIKKMIDDKKVQVLLKSNLSVRSLLNTVIKYYFIERNNEIPEDQFGLGFTNLIMIVAEILEYMERYPDTAYNSQINLIAIEEPETFMHPQMQEQFIDKINATISDLLHTNKKNINSQLIITTHSAHILNNKIQTGGTFNNINYIKEENRVANVIILNDEDISKLTKADLKKLKYKKTDNDTKKYKDYLNFEFIKKHIIHNLTNIFFADALIFVEGICEYNLLKYYISKNDKLCKQYISIVLIDGAHAKMYDNLISLINIPTLIITDLDIDRDPKEKGEKYKEGDKILVGDYTQITSLEGRKTTNETLKEYFGSDKKLEEYDYYEKDNLKVVFQKECNGVYPTSFEEAFILSNKDCQELKDILKELKNNIYSDIGNEKIKENSFQWQCKLNNDKAKFANSILYKEMTKKDDSQNIFKLPNYISDGLSFIEKKLEEENGLQ